MNDENSRPLNQGGTPDEELDAALQPLAITVINCVHEASASLLAELILAADERSVARAIDFAVIYECLAHCLHLVDRFAFFRRGDAGRTRLMDELVPYVVAHFVEYGVKAPPDLDAASVAQHKARLRDSVYEHLNEAHLQYSLVRTDDPASAPMALHARLTERLCQFTEVQPSADLSESVGHTIDQVTARLHLMAQTFLAVDSITDET